MQLARCSVLLTTVDATSSICLAETAPPIGRWVFDQAGRHDATITGNAKLVVRPVESLLLDGNTTSVEVNGIDAARLPQHHISAEAWVCLNLAPAG